LPRTEALKVVQECAEKGVKGMRFLLPASRKKDAEGGKIEQEIVLAARKGGIRLIGPNANGFYCPAA